MLVETGVVDLVEVRDELQDLLAAVGLVWSRGLTTCAVSFLGASFNRDGSQDLYEVDVSVEYRTEQSHPVERFWIATTEQLPSERKKSLRQELVDLLSR